MNNASHVVKFLLQSLLGRFGLAVMSSASFEELKRKEKRLRHEVLINQGRLPKEINAERIRFNSQSQLGQDLLALAITNFRRGGFFVEFGATDGKTLSNTFLLEKEFAWSGILAEPGRRWKKQLLAERSCIISDKAVWTVSGESFEFREALIGELSTLGEFVGSDVHSGIRSGRTYKVKTISLNDLLDSGDAPQHVDFMSIDTEGSELEILSGFDFNRRTFGLIAIEHNLTERREQIASLMAANGYVRVLMDLSDFDDWYVLESRTRNGEIIFAETV